MTDGLLLDTHIALWLDSGDERLRTSTHSLIDRCWRDGGSIFLSAITVWEIALLVDTERIALDLPVDEWVDRFTARPGVEAVPLRHRAAASSYTLHHLEHRDPADRLLIASAIDLDCKLVTYDRRIAAFARRYGGRYRFAVAV